jgi:hypothetical protein
MRAICPDIDQHSCVAPDYVRTFVQVWHDLYEIDQLSPTLALECIPAAWLLRPLPVTQVRLGRHVRLGIGGATARADHAHHLARATSGAYATVARDAERRRTIARMLSNSLAGKSSDQRTCITVLSQDRPISHVLAQ